MEEPTSSCASGAASDTTSGKRPVWGVDKVITTAFDTWPKEPARSERPYVFGAPEACRAYTVAAITLEQAHRERSERYLAGQREVSFPPGTYPPPPVLRAA